MGPKGHRNPLSSVPLSSRSKTLRASFNYQYSQKEPGAWVHNNKYIVQVLYDSIDDLDGDLTGLIRP
jgi:hypothetical protein